MKKQFWILMGLQGTASAIYEGKPAVHGDFAGPYPSLKAARSEAARINRTIGGARAGESPKDNLKHRGLRNPSGEKEWAAMRRRYRLAMKHGNFANALRIKNEMRQAAGSEKTVDYITPEAAKRLAGPMFPKLRQGFMAVGTIGGRSFRVGYVIPKGYYVEWDVAGHGVKRRIRRAADEWEAGLKTEAEIEARMAELKATAGESDEELVARIDSHNPPPEIRKTVYYFTSYEAAQSYAISRGWRANRIIPYQFGWAIQKHKGGGYYGPMDNPDQSNPGRAKIYNRVISMRASKAGMPHNCDDECKAHGHRYEHKFKEKACIYGNDDGSILMK